MIDRRAIAIKAERSRTVKSIFICKKVRKLGESFQNQIEKDEF
jgi:hypothetical protein